MGGPDSRFGKGTRELLEERVVNRTIGQLDPAVRKYSNEEAAGKLFDELIKAIDEDQWKPDVLVSWTDEAGRWSGGTIVGERLADRLGVPSRTVVVKEVDEDREVRHIPDLPTGPAKALLVVDAMITGRTYSIVRETLAQARPDIEQRCAALCVNPSALTTVDYRGVSLPGTDVLFPWGWARSTHRYYDVLKDLNVMDRRLMPRHTDGRLRTTSVISDEDRASVTLMSTVAGSEKPVLAREEHKDELLYVVSGAVEIEIKEATGTFKPEEFIFLPHIVPYKITFKGSATLLIIDFEPPAPGTAPTARAIARDVRHFPLT